MFRRVLIANRGEIACRIIGTCQRLGIEAIAVYSDADCRARHVRLADAAIYLGQPPAQNSYLNVDRILQAARKRDVEAIHPGYGFLAENADFAERCEQEKIVFVGPPASTIREMGSKQSAKRLMEDAGVPTVPGYHGDDQDIATLKAAASEIGFPVLIKASAGGGGKGMRIVHSKQEFELALDGARRVATSAFNDDRMIIEKYLATARHIEFQIFGDNAGNLIQLGERECSIQRRYQKIIEETPSPFLDDATRNRMGDAAVAAAAAVAYRNAGTVEFIVDKNRRFYFMEMNTRLQVEHPVTEMVTGLDLVEWQLKIAAGESLPLRQSDIPQRGHAIEARIYAEDAARDFLPSSGRVRRFLHPAAGSQLRIDNGIDDADVVSTYYDPMLAKLIVHASDRDRAIDVLMTALTNSTVFGIVTNIPLLSRITAHAAFRAGDIDTTYIDTHVDDLIAEKTPTPELAFHLCAARYLLDREQFATGGNGDASSPWHHRDNWRLGGPRATLLKLQAANGETRHYETTTTGTGIELSDKSTNVKMQATIGSDDSQVMLAVDGKRNFGSVWRSRDDFLVVADGAAYRVSRIDIHALGESRGHEAEHPGSPMPGRIVDVCVRNGDRVRPGQALLVLEGMKMEYTLEAGVDGTVKKVLFRVGDMVEAEVPLVDILPLGA